MTFNSYEFVLLFMPVFVAVYIFLRKIWRSKKNVRTLVNLWIILGSLCFYISFGMSNLAILLISICWNVCTSIPMSFMRDRNIKLTLFGKERHIQNIWLCIGIIGNIILLLFFKLSGIFLPIAISFYTFNQISYIVNLNKGEIEKFEPLWYLSYILFFPKILQGPIMEYTDYKNEINIACEKKLDYEVLLRALLLFAFGLFKKVILADTFGAAVNYGYDNLVNLGSLEAVLTAVFYSFQLYFDFSGYCDMAAAISQIIGCKLPDNFNSPYQAVNIVDFWKRWHITLTRFFTRYVYIPLGGNRKGDVRTYINLMIIFLLSGFWHGTGWTFLVWGAMHGALYVVTRFYEKKHKGTDKENKAAGNALAKAAHCAKVFLTFAYVTAAWVFFRADKLTDAGLLFYRMVTGGKKALATGFSSCFQLDELWYAIKITPIMKFGFAWDVCLWFFLIVSCVMIFFCKNAIEYTKECKIGIKSTILTAFLIVWCVVSLGGVSTFLYMNF
ncbi:MBOAT family O-acyltransferase [Butyrivibrio sp. YAB3001]|uniref:MBOAT family O-acyltransferase n=1 Tax=Butyrivibrio sp. YAB3001 TaxID=1520812 RepID=UPI0008F61EB5|nr:MBOAT family O-acyltransferase [Butyrivibrio sp. YAB3001]SFC77637.1 D-alanyl-lipoteichoic acid acyltransferase DltB, MBOAT superfamily [Butyrivibrio sp. YAB3001]